MNQAVHITRRPKTPGQQVQEILQQSSALQNNIRDALRSEDGQYVQDLINTSKAMNKTLAEEVAKLESLALDVRLDAEQARIKDGWKHDLQFAIDRIESGCIALRSRMETIAKLDEGKRAEFEEARKARDVIAEELGKKYPELSQELSNLLERAVKVENQVQFANRNRPSGEPALQSIEIVAGRIKPPEAPSVFAHCRITAWEKGSATDDSYALFNGKTKSFI